MSDRELLELAAKAAQHCMDYMRWDGYRFVEQKVHGVPHCGLNYEKTWNPLTDDGDALRLAVKLNLHICIDAESAGAITVEWGFDEGGCAQHSVVENSQDEPGDCAATRRAIVRAAAAIGKAMQ